MKYVRAFLNGLGSLFDTVAGIPPGELQNEIGLLVILGTTFGILHVTDTTGFIQAIFVLVSTVLAVGVALERVFKAAKGVSLPNPAASIYPSSNPTTTYPTTTSSK
jgi:Na+/proline symporter